MQGCWHAVGGCWVPIDGVPRGESWYGHSQVISSCALVSRSGTWTWAYDPEEFRVDGHEAVSGGNGIPFVLMMSSGWFDSELSSQPLTS